MITVIQYLTPNLQHKITTAKKAMATFSEHTDNLTCQQYWRFCGDLVCNISTMGFRILVRWHLYIESEEIYECSIILGLPYNIIKMSIQRYNNIKTSINHMYLIQSWCGECSLKYSKVPFGCRATICSLIAKTAQNTIMILRSKHHHVKHQGCLGNW